MISKLLHPLLFLNSNLCSNRSVVVFNECFHFCDFLFNVMNSLAQVYHCWSHHVHCCWVFHNGTNRVSLIYCLHFSSFCTMLTRWRLGLIWVLILSLFRFKLYSFIFTTFWAPAIGSMRLLLTGTTFVYFRSSTFGGMIWFGNQRLSHFGLVWHTHLLLCCNTVKVLNICHWKVLLFFQTRSVFVFLVATKALASISTNTISAVLIVVNDQLLGNVPTKNKDPILLSNGHFLTGVGEDVWSLIFPRTREPVQSKWYQSLTKEVFEQVVVGTIETLFWNRDLPQVRILDSITKVLIQQFFEIFG